MATPPTNEAKRDGLKSVVLILLAITILNIVATGGSIILLTSRDDDIDSISESVNVMDDNVAKVKTFVDDLEDQTPDEQRRNQAVTAAVEQVPQIKAILCSSGAFPEAEACQ